jgi:4-hydroxy-tetrahydrodipicolinate reductase
MITVGISGAPGRMGRLTLAAAQAADDMQVGGLYAPGHSGEEIHGHRCSDDPASLGECDVIVEFTNPDASETNVPHWRDLGAHVLIGTSGYTTERLDALRAGWGDGPGRCLVVPNFAIGAVLMMRFAELAAPHFESAEVIEMHHEDKPDAPSGTSLQTAARMAAARSGEPHGRGNEIVAGALGADVEGVAVHSIRLAGSVAHQEVILGTTGQYLTIRHDTTDYQAFAPGILLAIREIGGLADSVTVGLEVLLGV